MKTLKFTILVTSQLRSLVIVKNVQSVNLLCLIIHSATGHFKEKNGEKYLIIDSAEKYDGFFSGIISGIKTLNGGKKLFFKNFFC